MINNSQRVEEKIVLLLKRVETLETEVKILKEGREGKNLQLLSKWVMENANESRFLFTTKDFINITLELKLASMDFYRLLRKAERIGIVTRVCHGLWVCEKAAPLDGLFLFHVANILRSEWVNYISLESALSDYGVISQIPLQWITIVTSGKAAVIECGKFGTIEFIRTKRKFDVLRNELNYDLRCGMYRANVKLALRDMRVMRRNCDLIDWEIAEEEIKILEENKNEHKTYSQPKRKDSC